VILRRVRTGWVPLALVAITVQAFLARLPGWNPESLWSDDLVWAAIARAREFWMVLAVPAHAPPGFFATLWVLRAVFGDPEWSQQLLPFVSGIGAIVVVALAARALTGSAGLAVLAGALTALNPLAAHYTVYVKPYTFEFLATALLLWWIAVAWREREVSPRSFAAVSVLAGLGTFWSVTSAFLSAPIVNLAALRAWRSRRGVREILTGAVLYDVIVAGAALVMHARANARVVSDFRRGFLPLGPPSAVWTFLDTQGRRFVETSLPSWTSTDPWNPTTVRWTLPLVGLGLIWLVVHRPTRWVGVALVGFLGVLVAVSALEIYPIGIDRTDIFAFPVGIVLFVMGVHGATAWLPRREWLRTIAGLAAAAVAVAVPVKVAYWGVNDSRLITYLTAGLTPDEGLILSPTGTFLAAVYGPWPVTISGTDDRSNATMATIERDLTVHLRPRRSPKPMLDAFIDASHPQRLWYVAFRTGEEEEALKALTDRGYVLKRLDKTTRGSLYFGVWMPSAGG